jgi:glycosyltransferase involved in cell wall biosynthesis
MIKIKEVTVFTNGDSSLISTWSNVPYFFTETLLSMGLIVNRVDLSPSSFLERVFNRTFYRAVLRANRNSTYDYFRSWTHFLNVRYRIRKAINHYPNSDANIFLTFSFSSVGLTQKPSIQFCDWTYDHYFKYFIDRKPDFFEKQCIKRENSQIEGSDIVFCLFPGVAEYMKQYFKNENIYYLGNVINSLHAVSSADILKQKISSNSILFVGSKKYIAGAHALIDAFGKLKQSNPELSLHIIGMNIADFESLPKDVCCYGYLDKGNDADRDLYYKLFREAKLFVNTTPKWGAFSATIEAMYFYTPIIISPYDEFVKTFGSSIDFGHYCGQNSPFLIEESIRETLSDLSYESLCINAHKSVENFSWNAYMGKLIQTIEDKLNDR